MVVAVLLVVVGSARPQPTALLPPCSNGKPEAATVVVELLMIGMRKSKTCWAVFKWQVINLRSCCIWLVDSVECITYSESVSVFLPYLCSMQSAMRCVLLSSVACLILQNISTSPHKIFRKNDWTSDFRLSVQLLSEIFLILWTIQWDIVINVHRCPYEVPIILVTF